MPWVGFQDAGGVKNFRVGICDDAPSTARSSITFYYLFDLITKIRFSNNQFEFIN